jgi:glycosyltransferase involved in cell wall biosynthesis
VVTPDVAFAVPGSLDTPTGGYTYDRRVIAELAQLDCKVHAIDIGDEFPRPSSAALAAARAQLAKVRRGCPIVIDGLAFGAMPKVAAALGRKRPLIALVHHPLALETGLSAEEARRFRLSECAALAHARHVIVTSSNTKRILARDFAVERSGITVIRPGTDRGTSVRKIRAADEPVRLLSVGSLVPGKGYDVLLHALQTLVDVRWHLTIVGDRNRDPATAAQIAGLARAPDVSRRVMLEGAVPAERLGQFYADADVFVLASRFEGYGMAYAEAIAHGVPVIGTTAGAIPRTVPKGTGILVPPDDAAALASALRRLIVDPAERERLAAGARAAARRLPTWRGAARAFLKVIAAAK